MTGEGKVSDSGCSASLDYRLLCCLKWLWLHFHELIGGP